VVGGDKAIDRAIAKEAAQGISEPV
jgi:hypothetical protein